MNKKTIEYLDKRYKDYIFIGREDCEGNVIDYEVSLNPDTVKTLFRDLMTADNDLKWFLLDAVLKPFELANDEDYEELKERIKLCKRYRYVNYYHGKIPKVETTTEVEKAD